MHIKKTIVEMVTRRQSPTMPVSYAGCTHTGPCSCYEKRRFLIGAPSYEYTCYYRGHIAKSLDCREAIKACYAASTHEA